MTVYGSICGCLRSRPEPDYCDFSSEAAWRAAWEEWDREWAAEVAAHDAYRCQDRQRELGVCAGVEAHRRYLRRQRR